MPFALLKSVLVTMKIVDVESDVPLSEQLKFGIEIETWSDLPRGVLCSCLFVYIMVLLRIRTWNQQYSSRFVAFLCICDFI